MFISIFKSIAIEYLISVPTLKNKRRSIKKIEIKIKDDQKVYFE